MQRRPCLCGHGKSGHQTVEIKVTPKPCEACGCPRYRAASKKALRERALREARQEEDRAAQGRLFQDARRED